jgi:predicted dehydrogenase
MTARPAPPLRIALAVIEEADVVAVVSRRLSQARQVAAEYAVGYATTDLADVLNIWGRWLDLLPLNNV